MKKSIGKKILSLAMAIMMLAALIPSAAFASATFEVTSVTLTQGIYGISAVPEAVVTFSEAVEESTLAENITVSGGVTATAKKLTDTSYSIGFDKAFDYSSDYTLTFGAGIAAKSGAVLVEKTETFTTGANPVDVLWTENFDGDEATIWSRLTQISPYVNTDEKWIIEDGKLRIRAKDHDHYRPVVKINGSENWTDYEMTWDSKNEDYTRQHIVFARVDDSASTGYEVGSYRNTWEKTASAYISRKDSFWNNTVNPQSISREGSFTYNDSVLGMFKHKFTIIGSDMTLVSTYGDEVVTVTATDDRYATGGIAFTGREVYSYFDNVVISDRSEFRFAPEAIKIDGSEIILNFTKDITTDADVIAASVTVTDADGNPVASTAEANGAASVKVTLAEPNANTIYHVTVATTLTGANEETLKTAKTFEVRTGAGEGLAAEAPTLVSVAPANGSTLAQTDSITLTFSKEMNIDSLKNYISINNGAVSFDVTQVDGAAYKIVPGVLPFNSDITVALGEGIESADNGLFAAQTLAYKSDIDHINTLWSEDFNGDSATIMSRLTQISSYVASGESWGITDGQLQVRAKDHDHYRPVVKINGSENWTDYEMTWDSENLSYTRQQTVFARVDETGSKGYEVFAQRNTWAKTAGAYIKRKDSFWNGTVNVQSESKEGSFTYNDSIPGVFKNKFTIIGSNMTFVSTYGDEVITVTATDDTYATGGIAFTGLETYSRFDNVVITDKNAFTFAPDAYKLAGSEVVLNFTKDITTDADVIAAAVTVTDADGNPTQAVATPFGTDAVKVTLTNPSEETLYTINVAKTLVGANGETLTTAKSFDVVTTSGGSFAAQPPVISAVSPAKNAANVNVLDDIEITFSKDMDESTLAGNITINDGAIAFNIVKLSTKVYRLAPKAALPFDTAITVKLGDGIMSTDTGVLAAQEITFKTEKNTIDTLFYEDFDGDATETLTRFTQIGTMDSNESYSISGGKLLIAAKSTGSDPSWSNRPVLKINGSDGWKDYEIEWDSYVPDANTRQAYVKTRVGTWGTGYNMGGKANGWSKDFGGAIQKVTGTTSRSSIGTSDGSTLTYAVPMTYHAKASVIGSDLKLTITNGDETQVVTATDSTYASGGVAFTGHELNAYFDNVSIVDKGVTFTADKTKYVSGKVALTFTEAIDPASLKDAFVVTDSTGAAVNAIVSMGDEANVVNVSIPDYESNARYTIKTVGTLKTVDEETISGGKYVEILTDAALEIAALYLADADGEKLDAIGTTPAVKAVASVVNYKADRDFELVLAVYDNTGRLYKLETIKDVVASGDGTLISTETVAMPSNATDYKAMIFTFDSLYNIRPLGDSVTVLQ